jgi:plastocyanin
MVRSHAHLAKGSLSMIRCLAALLAGGALLAAGGCGSSSSSGGSPSTTTTATTPAATSGLKVNTTPKYAAPSSSQPVQSGVVQIAYRNIAISPDTVRVRVGSTIRWTNHDSVEHNVTSQGDRSKIGQQTFASKNFAEGASFTIKATRPGLIRYLCTLHPTTMNGTIEVVR